MEAVQLDDEHEDAAHDDEDEEEEEEDDDDGEAVEEEEVLEAEPEEPAEYETTFQNHFGFLIRAL